MTAALRSMMTTRTRAFVRRSHALFSAIAATQCAEVPFKSGVDILRWSGSGSASGSGRGASRRAQSECGFGSAATASSPPPMMMTKPPCASSLHASFSSSASAEGAEAESSTVTEEDLAKPEAPRAIGSERVHRLVDEITALSLLETVDLSKLLKERLGLSDMPMMPMGGGMMPMQGGAGGGAAATPAEEEQKEEKTSFSVKLEGFEAGAKIKVIKEVRALTSLGLKEAKELVEGAPKVLQEGLTKDEAEALKEKFAAVGAVVAIE